MSTVKITQADWDRVWLELAELRQSLNARPIAPTPDYRSDLPADEPCSCEESERLKAELGEAHVEIGQLKSRVSIEARTRSDWVAEKQASDNQLAAANALLERIDRIQPKALGGDIRAHLSGQSAAPARADAEQRVLDAVRTVERGSLEYYADAFGTETGWGAVSAAELARRGHG